MQRNVLDKLTFYRIRRKMQQIAKLIGITGVTLEKIEFEMIKKRWFIGKFDLQRTRENDRTIFHRVLMTFSLAQFDRGKHH